MKFHMKHSLTKGGESTTLVATLVVRHITSTERLSLSLCSTLRVSQSLLTPFSHFGCWGGFRPPSNPPNPPYGNINYTALMWAPPIPQLTWAVGLDWESSHSTSSCKPQRLSFSSFGIKVDMKKLYRRSTWRFSFYSSDHVGKFLMIVSVAGPGWLVDVDWAHTPIWS
jgi:hypothetical protein